MPAPRRRRPATEAEAAALASDIRMRIIRLTYRRPLTNKELALRLDKDPATTLYHVRRLLGAGFLEELTPRRGTRGAREKPYRATGTQLALDFRAAASGSAVNEAAFGAFLAEVAAFGVSALEQRRVVLQLPAEQRAELMDRIDAVLEDFRGRPSGSDGDRFAIYLASYDGN